MRILNYHFIFLKPALKRARRRIREHEPLRFGGQLEQVPEFSRFFNDVGGHVVARFVSQATKCNDASVRHTDTTMDRPRATNSGSLLTRDLQPVA
jgi:hypothetical protein